MARTKKPKPGPRRPYAPPPPPPKLSPLETIELELTGTEMTMRNAKSLRDKRIAWLIKELQHALDFDGTVDDNRARDLAEVIALDERIAAQRAHVASLQTVLAAALEMKGETN